MSRKLMRVPLDFRWPLKKTWHGYCNPWSGFAIECEDCKGSGSSAAARRYGDEWYGNSHFDAVAYGAKPLASNDPAIVAIARRNIERLPALRIDPRALAQETSRLWHLFSSQWSHQLIQADVDALVAAGRLMDFTRRPRTEEQAAALGDSYWMKESNGYTPTADEVNAWSMLSMGHDAINQWICVCARAARNGEATECSVCNGEGDFWPTPELKKAHDDWQCIEPPEGPGFQLWQTVSEGSPVSPVFGSLDELCAWCGAHATTFGSHRASAEEWKAMLEAGLVYHRQGHAIFM